MTRRDDPDEPRAEIIEVSNRRVGRSDADRRGANQDRARGKSGRWVTDRRLAIAAAGLVALGGLAVLVGQLNQLSAPGPHVSPAPSSIFPAAAGGLAVISVEAAGQKSLDPSLGDTELAVGGWYTELRAGATCYPTGSAGLPCPGRTSRLLSAPAVVFASDGSQLASGPGISAIDPVFVDPVLPPDVAADPRSGVYQVVPPTPAVLVGHFHDDRAENCPAGTSQSLVCDPAFVVDGVANLEGIVRSTPTSAATTATHLDSAAVVTAVRGQLEPGGYVLEFGPVGWFTDPFVFSVVERSADAPRSVGPTVWLVRGYLGGAASWLAIDDLTERMWGPLMRPPAANALASGIPGKFQGVDVEAVARTVRDEPGCCQLVAVGGYLSSDRSPEGCPPETTSGKPTPCGDTQLALVDQPASILQANDQTFLYDLAIPPGTPSIRPLFLPGTTAPDPWAGLTGLATRIAPRQVILVGQFGDPRSPECAARPGGGNASCDGSFVVDQVAWIEGATQGPSVSIEPGLVVRHTAEQVAAVVPGYEKAGSSIWIVSLTATSRAESQSFGGVSILDRGAGTFWIVRLFSSLAGGTAVSGFLVFDDSNLALIGAGF